MGKSHQTGSLVLRGKRWYGYYRREVVDPTTDTVRVVRVVLRLGLKSQTTKLAAREALRTEIAKQTGKIADGRTLQDGAATFEWFVRNRYLPLRHGRLATRDGERKDGTKSRSTSSRSSERSRWRALTSSRCKPT